jgi:ubiquinone/menaquinone biosynthesis C-methylase UbiE
MKTSHKTSPFSQTYAWLTERLYNELAWAYDPISWVVSGGKWASWRKEVLTHIAGERVLELGFGTGELLLAMHRCGFTVYGLELSQAMHKITTRKLQQHGIVIIPRVRAVAQHLPYPSNSFDTVVATFPTGYVFDPDTFTEVRRVLRSPHADSNVTGGRFVIVGLYADYRGKTFGWISEEYLLNEDKRGKLAPGWGVQIIRPTREQLTLPIVIFEKRNERHER